MYTIPFINEHALYNESESLLSWQLRATTVCHCLLTCARGDSYTAAMWTYKSMYSCTNVLSSKRSFFSMAARGASSDFNKVIQ